MVCLEARFGWGIRHDDWFRTLNCWLPVQIYWEIQAPRKTPKGGKMGLAAQPRLQPCPTRVQCKVQDGSVRSTLFSVEIFSIIFRCFEKCGILHPSLFETVVYDGLDLYHLAMYMCIMFIYIYIYTLLRKGLRFRSLIIFHSRETDLVLPRLPNASLSQSIEGKEGKWLP